MGGLIGALTMGAVGGAGKGMSENAQADMKFNYDQMREQMRAEMEQRIYERSRGDKAADYTRDRSDKLADDEKAYKRGLIKDKPADEYRAMQAEELRAKLANEKEIKKMREDLAQAELLAKNDPAMLPIVEARRKKLDTLLGAKPTESYSLRTETNPDTGEKKEISEVKGLGKPSSNQRIIDYTDL